jgi:sulfite reductase (ferredoxin)
MSTAPTFDPAALSRRSVAGSREFVAREIDNFQKDITRFREGRIPEAVFLEERLRLGLYGQRQDGVHMMRSKLPLGLMGAAGLDAFADIAERFGSGNAHLTTRQDIQIHFVTMDGSTDVMRVLDAHEITSKEACGNVVRNVTGAPISGIWPGEPFDVTPYGMELTRFLLRHPDGQSLGRKFKITLAGTDDALWNMGAYHDLGLTARVRDGQRGFRVVVGGGLGSVAFEAQEYTDFLPEEELFPFAQALLKLFAIHGEKKKRARARMKFLLAKWGMERFREEVEAVRAGLSPDPEWTSWLDRVDSWGDTPLHGPARGFPSGRTNEEATWLRTNVYKQAQKGYSAVKIRVPTGDLNPSQLRGLASLLRRATGDTLRITPDQELLLRWVPNDRLLEVHGALIELGLGLPRAGGLGDTVTCPGADTCKLGITSPRSIARAIQPVLDELALNPALEHLRIHVSGCPNGCATHQVADIGLFGAAKTINGTSAPHYMLMLGGRAGGTDGVTLGAGFGMVVIKMPAARVGASIRRITALYLEEGEENEAFGAFTRRLGRRRFKDLLVDLTELPPFDVEPDAYREPGSDVAFAVVRGVGECEGAAIEQSDLLLAEADREADLALERLEDGASARDVAAAAKAAMHLAARALLSTENVNEADEDVVEARFRSLWYEPGRIFEGMGHHFLGARHEDPGTIDDDRKRRLVVEAGLFVEEVHGLVMRLNGQAVFPRAKKQVGK